MENEKIKLTKRLVIEVYKRSYFYRYFKINLFSVIYLIAFIIWYDDLYRYMTVDLKSVLTVLIVFPAVALILIFVLILHTLELLRVLKGSFYITTDKIIKCEETKYKRYLGRTDTPNLQFEKYGRYSLYKAYSPLKRKIVSAQDQLYEAYVDDIYYVAVTNKNKEIIAAFNPKDYTDI